MLHVFTWQIAVGFSGGCREEKCPSLISRGVESNICSRCLRLFLAAWNNKWFPANDWARWCCWERHQGPNVEVTTVVSYQISINQQLKTNRGEKGLHMLSASWWLVVHHLTNLIYWCFYDPIVFFSQENRPQSHGRLLQNTMNQQQWSILKMSFYKSGIETSAALTRGTSEPEHRVTQYTSLYFVLHCVIITNQSNLTSSQKPMKGISPPPPLPLVLPFMFVCSLTLSHDNSSTDA